MNARLRDCRDAFTLIELLVVVSITAILLGLLLAALPAFRDGGRAAKCTANMREIFAGMQGYLQDNHNHLMQRFYPGNKTGYDELISPYLGDATNVFTCPSQLHVRYPNQPGYGLNWYYDNQSIFTVDQLSKTILLAETLGSGVGSHRADRDSNAPGQLDKLRHRGRANYLFFDGHVETLKYEDTRQTVGQTLDAGGKQIAVDMWGVYHNDHRRPTPL